MDDRLSNFLGHDKSPNSRPIPIVIVLRPKILYTPRVAGTQGLQLNLLGG